MRFHIDHNQVSQNLGQSTYQYFSLLEPPASNDGLMQPNHGNEWFVTYIETEYAVSY